MTKVHLHAGEQAPHFAASDVFGKVSSLDNYKEGYVLLVFLRYAGCPWCNLALYRLVMETKQLSENDCHIIAFIQSDKATIIQGLHKYHPVKPIFPIVADPDMKIYQEYGVGSSIAQSIPRFIKEVPDWVRAVRQGYKQEEIDGDLFVVPALFLMKATTKSILKAWYGASFYEHQAFTPVYEALAYDEAAS